MILAFLTVFVFFLAFIFLFMARRDIPLQHWHRVYFLHVLCISVPIALISGWLLTLNASTYSFTLSVLITVLQILSIITYTMTAWLSLIFTGALLIRGLAPRYD
jgi:hypothetical protein